VEKVTNVIDDFLKPTFEGSRLFERHPSDGLLTFGLVLGAVIGLTGIAIAYRVWVKQPGIAERVQQRFALLHRLFVNKWYFDEIYDTIAVRPFAWLGRTAQQTFERVVVNGVLVGGAVSVVRAGSAAVRAAQSGFLRYYAALLVLGISAVGLYFLLVSS
jgi:NADH-quinone oxidoreductase subunit L